jgi:hypothetical protein
VRVTCAVLCDAVTIREGLLHILGGGINRLGRPVFPASMDAQLAMLVVLDQAEANQDHQLVLELKADPGQSLNGMVITFGAGTSGELEHGELIGVPLALSLPFALPQPGLYRIEVSINDTPHAAIPFRVLAVEPRPPEAAREPARAPEED